MFLILSHDLAKPCDYMVTCLYGYKAVQVSRHPAKFFGHRYCGSGDTLVLVSHVISSACQVW